MQDPELKEKAEFNMAISYLNRMNVLFSACDQASINLDCHAWFHSLCAIFRELSTWMDAKQIKEFDDNIQTINPMVRKSNAKYLQTGMQEMADELYMDLHRFELALRQVANKAGLMMKITDDAMKALK
uniref:Uncharacterized protein n=1 Tax=viral metagenome TaxID=1070528 RepID=A0A6M3IGY3_9ZZZZ